MKALIPQMQPLFEKEEQDAVSAYMASGGWITEFKKTSEFEDMINYWLFNFIYFQKSMAKTLLKI